MTNPNSPKWLTPLLLFYSISLISNAQAGSALSAGSFHACGIKDDSTLICWGYNEYNQANPPEGTFTQVSAGKYFNCALRVDGSIACWGRDTAGETSPPPGHYAQVEAGGEHACALTSDGTPICWGSNSSSQVGFLTSNKFQQLALGYNHSCGLKEDGTIECWGGNSEEQSTAIDDETFSSILAGYYTTCGIKTDGIVTCCGDNNRNYGYLTQIDFDALAKKFVKGNQHTETERLKSILQYKLRNMIRLNRSRMDYLEKYKDLIDVLMETKTQKLLNMVETIFFQLPDDNFHDGHAIDGH